LLIDYQCPQCGAPATLDETDHLFECGFCRVKSYLLSRVYRYVLPHRAAEGVEVVYVPYWRFKGMLFSCAVQGIQHRIVDVSYRALGLRQVPATVGIRSQTLKLQFLTPETAGRFLQPDVAYTEMLEKIRERYALAGSSPLFFQEFIGETLSLLYAPFYLQGDRLFDAVLNRPVSGPLPDDVDLAALHGGRPRWRLQFVPAQCPECGWDLEGARDSLALDCRNCHSVWHAGKKQFMKISFASFPSPEGAEAVCFLPFWKIRAKVSGIPLDSLADLVRLANLPKAVTDPMEKRPFHFWAPAFKVRPQDFLRFSLRTTLSQPEGEGDPHLPEGDLYPVTLPVNEAMESLKLNLASFMKPPRKLLPKLPEIAIEARDVVLIYVPFQIRGNELTYPPSRLRINRNLLRYAKQL